MKGKIDFCFPKLPRITTWCIHSFFTLPLDVRQTVTLPFIFDRLIKGDWLSWVARRPWYTAPLPVKCQITRWLRQLELPGVYVCVCVQSWNELPVFLLSLIFCELLLINIDRFLYSLKCLGSCLNNEGYYLYYYKFQMPIFVKCCATLLTSTKYK